jgi:hypothetical protein
MAVIEKAYDREVEGRNFVEEAKLKLESCKKELIAWSKQN